MTVVRWWLRSEEVCVFCVHSYARGAHVHCATCDRAVCACCYERGPAPAREPICPECVEGGDED